MRVRYLFVFASILCFSVSFSVTSEWHHCTVLDGEGKYHVCWRTDFSQVGNEEIEFLAEVQAHGYVGFGLSPNGGMSGSDIVTGWVKDGHVFFQDRHGKGNFLPELDASADWKLVSGSENDSHTVLVFRRKLDTCDKDDIKIDDSTVRLIYAYSEEDPETEEGIRYHKNKRGTKSVLLLQKSQKENSNLDKASLKTWDILSPNFTIKSEFTTKYWCKIYKAPEVSEKNHIVLVEPLIEAGHEGYVHHLLLYECVGATPEEYDPHLDLDGHQCHRPNMPDAMKKCEGVTLAWAIGGSNFVLPEHVGMPMETGPSKYYMMEMHYDNPTRSDGIVDQSGFRIYYTPQLRKYDAGILMIGSTVSFRHIIPPGQKEYVVAGHSNTDCYESEFPEDGVKVLGTLLHAHLMGRKLKARHFRNQTELPPLGEDDTYDFNYQDYRYYKEVDFLPKDQVTLECTYDSSDRETVTFGGETTREEMCLVFLLYYPRIERFGSLSVPKLETINEAFGTNFSESYEFYLEMKQFNWTSVDVAHVESKMRYGLHDTLCYIGDGDKHSITSSVSYPPLFQRYQKTSTCTHSDFQTDIKNSSWKERVDTHMLILLLLYFTVLKYYGMYIL